MIRHRHLIALASAVAALALVPSVTQAAFPGANGLIAMTATDPSCCSAIHTIDASGNALTRLTSAGDGAAWSPDGRKIAFSSDSSGAFEIHTMNFDGTDEQQVTHDVGRATEPAWSPDGKQIAFTKLVGLLSQIYILDLATGNETPLTTYPSDNIAPAWSPDGTTIAFTSYRNIRGQIFTIPAQGGAETALTSAGIESDSPSWSPDGKQIAFMSSPNSNAEIYVMDASGANQTDITNNPANDTMPAWSPDGKQIAFTSDRSANPAPNPFHLYTITVDGNPRVTSQPLTSGPNDESLPDWQPLPGATITVQHVLRPASPPRPFDLMVDGLVVRRGALNGDAGTAPVAPGTHRVQAGDTPDLTTSISCDKNGQPDISIGVPAASIDVTLNAGDAEVCTVTHTVGQYAAAGSGVTISPPDVTTGTSPVTITFADVLTAGATTLTTSSAGPPAPAGYELGGVYYDLVTGATFSSADVCFAYSGARPTTIVHWIGGTPTFEPVHDGPTPSTVCATVTSFSPFALARSTATADTEAPVIACGAADGAWHAANVSIDCTARDTGSGLADDRDATFSLSTSVPAGAEDADARTGSRSVCDIAGNCATAGPIAGNKVDRKAPALSLPSDRTVDATAPAGATVTFSASAADGADPHPSVSCAPASGSVFAIGTTTVACRATDHVGNAASGSFKVVVLGAKEQLDRLVRSVVAATNLPAALKTLILAKLQTAVAAFDPSKPAQQKLVCTALSDFTAAVRLLSGHGIPVAQATGWIDDANRISAVLGCAALRGA